MPEHLDLHVRFEVEEEAGIFRGHAAVFGERNRHREIYKPGAFAATLAEHRAQGVMPPMFWSHDPAQVIGTWTDMREDERGLAVTGQLLMDTTRGREVASMLKAKAATGLSIGFRPRRSERGANGTRIITDAELAEVSIVALPSAGGARVTGYRQTPGNPNLAGFVEACHKTAKAMERKP